MGMSQPDWQKTCIPAQLLTRCVALGKLILLWAQTSQQELEGLVEVEGSLCSAAL